jgi:hypothetical protein
MGERLQALQPDTVETRLLHLLVERRRQVVDETYAPWQIEHFSMAATKCNTLPLAWQATRRSPKDRRGRRLSLSSGERYLRLLAPGRFG